MNRSYNVAIIAGQLVVGGAERQLYFWLSGLDREKFQPVVITLHPGHGDYWERVIEDLDIPLFPIPRCRNPLARLFDIARVLRPYEPQLIHGWHLFASPYAGAAGKLLNARSLGGLRGSFQTIHQRPVEANLTLLLVDGIVANSVAAADQLRAARKRRKQTVYAVQNAIEDQTEDRLEMRAKLSRHFGLSPAAIWIASLGRLVPGKRFDLLLQVIGLLRQDVENFHFLLIGDGPERLRLEKMTQTLDIVEHVTFAGEIPGASAWLPALDIFCFTSTDEGCPNAVMEAAIAGVPIVSWRFPFMEELLKEGAVALLVEPMDLVGLKDALLELIQSPELRKKKGDAARNHVLENFTRDRYIQRMSSVYEDLLGIQQAMESGRS